MNFHIFLSGLEKVTAKTEISFDNGTKVVERTRLKAECEELYRHLLIVGG